MGAICAPREQSRPCGPLLLREERGRAGGFTALRGRAPRADRSVRRLFYERPFRKPSRIRQQLRRRRQPQKARRPQQAPVREPPTEEQGQQKPDRKHRQGVR